MRQRTLRTFTPLALAALAGCGGGNRHVAPPPSSLSASQLEAFSIDELLIRHEGLRLKPYADAGNRLTIGVGRNLDDSGITREEAMLLLHNDIERVSRELDQKLPWWRGLSETRQKVLVSMAFNLGMPKLLGFRNMLAALEEGDFSAAAGHMLASRWAGQVGSRAAELAYMMENG